MKYSEKQRIEFDRGQAYLLTGKSGAGKTHLANCITRQNTDSKLDIQINETPLDDVNYNVWRNSVLMVDKNQLVRRRHHHRQPDLFPPKLK